MRQLIPLLVALAFTGACGGDETADAVTVKPTLASIQENVFDRSCSASSCHGSGKSGGLDLRDGSSHSSLVNVDAVTVPGLKRVVPADPGASFLLTKLTGPSSSQGPRMPLGGKPLSTDKINAISTWIQNGARP